MINWELSTIADQLGVGKVGIQFEASLQISVLERSQCDLGLLREQEFRFQLLECLVCRHFGKPTLDQLPHVQLAVEVSAWSR